MPNHPNRGCATAASNPTPAEIRAAREAAGLTQAAAARLLHTSTRAYQQWESGERRMHPAFWELFQIKLEVSYEYHRKAEAGKGASRSGDDV